MLIWHLASTSGLVNETLFPPPVKVLHAFIMLSSSGELLMHVNASIWRVFAGLAAGGIAGIVVGLSTGRNYMIDKALSPILQVFRSFPPVAIIPLVIVWLGVGETAKLFSISFAVFFPVWVNSHIGAASIPSHYLQAASSLTKSWMKTNFMVVLPASLPYIIAGIRTGVSIAFIMVFVAELAGASMGIGYLISVSHLAYRIDRMLVGLFTLGFLGAGFDYAFTCAAGRLFPWVGRT